MDSSTQATNGAQQPKKPHTVPGYVEACNPDGTCNTEVTEFMHLSFLHMTLFFLGMCVPSNQMLVEIKERLTGLDLRLRATGEARFGPGKNIPVVLLEFLSQETDMVLRKIRAKFGRLEQWQVESGLVELPPANWHLTVKHQKLRETILGLDHMRLTGAGIKQLGPHDPVYTVHFGSE